MCNLKPTQGRARNNLHLGYLLCVQSHFVPILKCFSLVKRKTIDISKIKTQKFEVFDKKKFYRITVVTVVHQGSTTNHLWALFKYFKYYFDTFKHILFQCSIFGIDVRFIEIIIWSKCLEIEKMKLARFDKQTNWTWFVPAVVYSLLIKHGKYSRWTRISNLVTK